MVGRRRRHCRHCRFVIVDDDGPGLDQLAFTKTCGYFPTREDVERFVVEGEAESAPSAGQTSVTPMQSAPEATNEQAILTVIRAGNATGMTDAEIQSALPAGTDAVVQRMEAPSPDPTE